MVTIIELTDYVSNFPNRISGSFLFLITLIKSQVSFSQNEFLLAKNIIHFLLHPLFIYNGLIIFFELLFGFWRKLCKNVILRSFSRRIPVIASVWDPYNTLIKCYSKISVNFFLFNFPFVKSWLKVYDSMTILINLW